MHRRPAHSMLIVFLRSIARRLIYIWRRSSVGWISLGLFRRTQPASRTFGFDRGTPIDRYYIEKFLSQYSSDIRGRTLEIADNNYTIKFGGTRVTRSDILHVLPGNPSATIVADLTKNDPVPERVFDCIILTQTLNFVYDKRALLQKLNRMLAPGGVLIATASGISQISRYDMERWGDYWRFTSLSLRRLCEECFENAKITVTPYGNVLVAAAALYGLAVEDMPRRAFEVSDGDYEMLIGLRVSIPPEAKRQ